MEDQTEKSVDDIYESLTDEQKEALEYYIGISYRTHRKRIVADSGYEHYYDAFESMNEEQRKLCRRLIGMAADKGVKERRKKKWSI